MSRMMVDLSIEESRTLLLALKELEFHFGLSKLELDIKNRLLNMLTPSGD
jgi:hypothetical protein